MGSENMFLGISQGAQGLMGAFTAAQGAAAMFGAEEEKLQKIQTKLQASMSVLMGLQRMGNILQSTSQFRVQVLNKLLAKWYAWNLKVAESEGIKRAAMIAGAAGIAALIAAIAALVIQFSKYNDEVKRARELQKAFRKEYASSATSELQTLAKLKAGWDALNGDIEKQQKFLHQYKNEFQSLDGSINSVAAAERAMNEGTQDIIDNIKRKAKAAAYLAQVYDLLGKIANNEAKLELPKPQANWADYALYGLTGGWLGGTSFDEYMQSTYGNMEERIHKENKEFEEELKRITESEGFKNAMAGLLDETDRSFEKSVAARLEAARKGYESILRLNQDMENRLADARIAAIQNETQREIESLRQQHDKRMQEIQREKEDYIEKLKEQAKLEFLAGNPNADAADFGTNWQPTSEQRAYIEKYYGEMAQIEEDAFNRNYSKLIQKQQQSRLDFMKKFGSPEMVRQAIEDEYTALMNEAAQKGDIWEWLRLMNEKREKLWQSENASRLEYLSQYGTFEEKVSALNEKYLHDLAQTNDKYQKELLKARHAQDLFMLEQQKGGRYYNVFRDTSRQNIVQIQDAIRLVEEDIKEMSKDLPANADKVAALQKALENLKSAANDFSLTGFLRNLFSTDKDNPEETASLAERLQKMKEAWDNMSADEKWRNVGGWASNIAKGLTRAAEAMNQIAEIAGDTRFKDFADQFSSIAQNFSAAGQGAAQGGWIGAIVGGASDMIAQTAQAITETAILEAQAKRNADDWAFAIKNVAAAMDEVNYNSPFGERNLAKGQEAMRASVEATRRYGEEIAALNKKYSEQEIDKYARNSVGGTIFGFGAGGLLDMMTAGTTLGAAFLAPLLGLKKDKISNEFKALEEAFAKGYEGLQRMLVKTKDRSGWANVFGFQDEYTALGELYPELFKDGELVIEQAKLLLETNNALDETQRKEIQNVIDLKEAYEEAMRTIDDVIADTFGNIASDVTDIIWDSVMNGTDAWEQFEKTGAEAISALGKQLIQEMVISTYLEQFKERMRNAYLLGDATATGNELRNIMGDIFGGLQTVFDAGSAIAQDYKDWASERGFDLTEAAERTAASKAISGVTQESFDDALGRFTAIQSHTYELNETTKALREQQANLLAVTSSILYEVQGIHRDTERMQASLDTIQGDMTIVRSNTSTMNDKGVRMLN